MRVIIACALLIFMLPPGARADEVSAEIDYLMLTVGNSDCIFIRNGKRHDAQKAEAHLRGKYRRGKRHAPTSEKFIENLASKSSMSGKPYLIQCESDHQIAFGLWLTQLLNEYRASSDDLMMDDEVSDVSETAGT